MDTRVHSRRERDLLKRFVPLGGRGADGKALPPRAVSLQSSMSWKLVQRVISRPDDDPGIAKAIKSLQLWK